MIGTRFWISVRMSSPPPAANGATTAMERGDGGRNARGRAAASNQRAMSVLPFPSSR
jgi:hypothetical protein